MVNKAVLCSPTFYDSGAKPNLNDCTIASSHRETLVICTAAIADCGPSLPLLL